MFMWAKEVVVGGPKGLGHKMKFKSWLIILYWY